MDGTEERRRLLHGVETSQLMVIAGLPLRSLCLFLHHCGFNHQLCLIDRGIGDLEDSLSRSLRLETDSRDYDKIVNKNVDVRDVLRFESKIKIMSGAYFAYCCGQHELLLDTYNLVIVDDRCFDESANSLNLILTYLAKLKRDDIKIIILTGGDWVVDGKTKSNATSNSYMNYFSGTKDKTIHVFNDANEPELHFLAHSCADYQQELIDILRRIIEMEPSGDIVMIVPCDAISQITRLIDLSDDLYELPLLVFDESSSPSLVSPDRQRLVLVGNINGFLVKVQYGHNISCIIDTGYHSNKRIVTKKLIKRIMTTRNKSVSIKCFCLYTFSTYQKLEEKSTSDPSLLDLVYLLQIGMNPVKTRYFNQFTPSLLADLMIQLQYHNVVDIDGSLTVFGGKIAELPPLTENPTKSFRLMVTLVEAMQSRCFEPVAQIVATLINSDYYFLRDILNIRELASETQFLTLLNFTQIVIDKENSCLRDVDHDDIREIFPKPESYKNLKTLINKNKRKITDIFETYKIIQKLFGARETASIATSNIIRCFAKGFFMNFGKISKHSEQPRIRIEKLNDDEEKLAIFTDSDEEAEKFNDKDYIIWIDSYYVKETREFKYVDVYDVVNKREISEISHGFYNVN